MPLFTVEVKRAYMKTTELKVIAKNSDDAYDSTMDRIEDVPMGELVRDRTFDEITVLEEKEKSSTIMTKSPNSRSDIVVTGQIKQGRLTKLIGRIRGGNDA